MNVDISHFLDQENKIKVWPSKKDKKLEVLSYLSTKFESGRSYTEKEVNQVIESWHTFGDYFLLRRGLVDYHFLSRTKSGSSYWKEDDVSISD
ncbi:MAG TPA: DUF2087 domain-containing protein [Clostridia bacterium]|nr:DUF2087 domain-containing protein [Clostridia bacterium]